MDVGQKVVFVRAVKGAEVGKHGTVMKVADDMVVVDCTLQENAVPVMAQMWDVLPERLWERLLKRRTIGARTAEPFRTQRGTKSHVPTTCSDYSPLRSEITAGESPGR